MASAPVFLLGDNNGKIHNCHDRDIFLHSVPNVSDTKDQQISASGSVSATAV
jgi:predicted ABC-class ATPase